MALFRTVILEVPHEAIIACQGMKPHQIRKFMVNNHHIPAEHVYGYGIRSGVTVVDGRHITYEISTSCE